MKEFNIIKYLLHLILQMYYSNANLINDSGDIIGVKEAEVSGNILKK